MYREQVYRHPTIHELAGRYHSRRGATYVVAGMAWHRLCNPIRHSSRCQIIHPLIMKCPKYLEAVEESYIATTTIGYLGLRFPRRPCLGTHSYQEYRKSLHSDGSGYL